MCGIAGFWSPQAMAAEDTRSKCISISHLLAHRGPDDEGFVLVNSKGQVEKYRGNYSNPNINLPHIETANNEYIFALIHRRLSIISPGPDGHQPMQGNKNILAYNGEIFNYKNLDKSNSYLNKSNTDSETLLHLLEDFHLDAMPYLDGFYAFANYQPENNELILAVDPTSVKHLFYAEKNGLFCFASESKVIRKTLELTDISEKAVFHFMAEGMIQVPDNNGNPGGFIQGIHKLKAGHFIRSRNPLKIYSEPYVQNLKPRTGNLNDHLQLDINARFMSDVPLGFACSGGLDSAVISGAARKYVGSDIPLKLFSVISPGYNADESQWQKKVAEFNRAEWITCNTEDIDAMVLGEVIRAADMPAISWNNLAHFMLCKKVKESRVTVLFNGQGADELFGGYPDYLKRNALQNLSLIFKTNTHWPLSFYDIMKGWMKLKIEEYFPEKILNSLYFNQQNGWLSEELKGYTPYSFQLARLDAKSKMTSDLFGQKLGQMLLWEDLNGMAHHLESRNPFADNMQLAKDLEIYGFGEHITGGYTKNILRKITKDIVPEEILKRADKKGFTVPESALIRKNIHHWTGEWMSSALDQYVSMNKRELFLNNIEKATEKDFQYFFRYVSFSTYLNQLANE